jgi:hypothetical protein
LFPTPKKIDVVRTMQLTKKFFIYQIHATTDKEYLILRTAPLFLYKTQQDYFAERSRPSSAGIGRSAWGVIRAPWRACPDSLKSTIADCRKISTNLNLRYIADVREQ